MGLRWQERDPGESWTPERSGASGAAAPGADSAPPAAAGALILGTHRDLWAAEATERNPALRFLAPTQRLELSTPDAEELDLEHGDPVTVSSNGHRVDALVSLKARVPQGSAFLIEGVEGANANVFAGAPVPVQVTKREVPTGRNGSGATIVQTPMPAEGAK
jgi:anaerobic selenocysteine-containing dehydrogenase